jgi:uncharacterized membrane protein YbhN (UPF0104 family)
MPKLSPTTQQRLFNVARIVVSVGLLAFLLFNADFAKLLETLREADWRPYALGLVATTVGIFLRAERWRILLHAVGAPLTFGRVLYLVYIGSFFNTFLPTGFGGDVIRVLEIGDGATKAQAAGTVLVDRLSGFVTLFVLALVGLPFTAGLLPPLLTLLIALLAIGVMGASLLLYEGHLVRRLMGWLPRPLSLAGDTWLGQTYVAITSCGWRALLRAHIVALLLNLLIIAGAYCVTLALQLSISIWTLAAFIPVITVSLLIPISISGFGVRETVAIALFTTVGVTPLQAGILALGWYSLDFFDGLVGGVIYLIASLKNIRTT